MTSKNIFLPLVSRLSCPRFWILVFLCIELHYRLILGRHDINPVLLPAPPCPRSPLLPHHLRPQSSPRHAGRGRGRGAGWRGGDGARSLAAGRQGPHALGSGLWALVGRSRGPGPSRPEPGSQAASQPGSSNGASLTITRHHKVFKRRQCDLVVYPWRSGS